MKVRILALGVFGVLAAGTFRAGVASQTPHSGRSVWDGVYTDAQAATGQRLYMEECSNCHGGGLEGADVTPGLVGSSFGGNWNDLTVGDLTERIRTTMPAQQPGKLSRQQTADVVAFILKSNQWPAGGMPLPANLAAQKQITIHSMKR